MPMFGAVGVSTTVFIEAWAERPTRLFKTSMEQACLHLDHQRRVAFAGSARALSIRDSHGVSAGGNTQTARMRAFSWARADSEGFMLHLLDK